MIGICKWEQGKGKQKREEASCVIFPPVPAQLALLAGVASGEGAPTCGSSRLVSPLTQRLPFGHCERGRISDSLASRTPHLRALVQLHCRVCRTNNIFPLKSLRGYTTDLIVPSPMDSRPGSPPREYIFKPRTPSRSIKSHRVRIKPPSQSPWTAESSPATHEGDGATIIWQHVFTFALWSARG